MTSHPRVKISPDQRVYVHTGLPMPRPWLLFAPNGGFVHHEHSEALSDDQVADWPEYGPPSSGESRDPNVMREQALAALNAKNWDLPRKSAISAEGHAVVSALLYVGDLLNGIGYLLANPVEPAAPAENTHPVDHLVKTVRAAHLPDMHVHFTEKADLRSQVVADILALANIRVTQAEVRTWDPDMRERAAAYAAAVHLHASDNPDVVIPQRPAFLPREGDLTRDT